MEDAQNERLHWKYEKTNEWCPSIQHQEASYDKNLMKTLILMLVDQTK